jgi:monoterpene epsilon-lactone hydrolase
MDEGDPRLTIARSVSAEARAILAPLGRMIAGLPPRMPPVTQAGFDAAAATMEAMQIALTADKVAALGLDTIEAEIAGVPTITVRPPDWRDNGTVLVYVHGGGFVQGSARASLLMAGLMAVRTGRQLVSVDYTLAPRADYRAITDQVAAVCGAVLAERPGGAVGLCGESAGGAIAAAVLLKLRERDLPHPSAAVLISPVTDLAADGDTHATLAPYDFLAGSALKDGAYRAYAPAGSALDPIASPLYGRFTPDFPPILIQVGTREILLSDSVRLHRAIRAGGGASILDVYDGMPHVFESIVPDAPEGVQAWAEIDGFWRRHLQGR